MNQALRITAVAATLAMACGTSFALDLVDSYLKARQADPGMLAADAAVIAGREKAVQGRALMKPQMSLSASVAHVDSRSSSSLPPQLSEILKPQSSGTMHEAAVQLKQPLYNEKNRADGRQLQQQTELSEIGWRDASQELMQRVSEAYFNLLLSEENLRVVEAEKGAVQMQRDRAQARFDVGRGKVTDLQEAQARYDSVLTKEVSAQSTLSLRQAQYQELTGAPGRGLARLRAGFPLAAPQPDDLSEWQRRGEAQNTRVRVKQSELAMAAAEIGKYKLSGRPTLDLVASYTDKGQNGSLSPLVSPDHGRSAVVGLQLNIPLFTGGALQSKEREAIARQRQAEQELGGARRDARLQVQDAYLAVKTGVSRVASLEQSVRSAQTALEATTLGRDVGTRTELDVLDAQQRLFSAQLELAQARNDYLLGRIRLAASAGELQEGDLQAINAFLAG
ncbi:TolC family outer membrane protein [Piscinibacter sp. XHJ-5]|uniref:TolC family outer membrane protein n=1 Tax=Piscinibacter sp. XHJ-5 TaxID=3037797 RepID=UPI00245286A9|nr:TolC family outer membrane protein [Piscinibacter sp. XHJ-5]